MDLQHDNLTAAQTGIPGGAVVDSLGSTVKNLAAGIRNKAKAKQAQKIADAGNYWTLRPFLKNLIKIPQYILNQVAGQGITEDAVINLDAQATGASNTQIINALKQMSGTSVGAGGIIGNTNIPAVTPPPETKGFDFKKALPYIIGVVVIGIVIFFIVKRK
jgi:hypothetical protein